LPAPQLASPASSNTGTKILAILIAVSPSQRVGVGGGSGRRKSADEGLMLQAAGSSCEGELSLTNYIVAPRFFAANSVRCVSGCSAADVRV
jgi:hypothetical protein